MVYKLVLDRYVFARNRLHALDDEKENVFSIKDQLIDFHGGMAIINKNDVFKQVLSKII